MLDQTVVIGHWSLEIVIYRIFDRFRHHCERCCFFSRKFEAKRERFLHISRNTYDRHSGGSCVDIRQERNFEKFIRSRFGRSI